MRAAKIFAALLSCGSAAAALGQYTVPAFTGAAIQSTVNAAFAAGPNNVVLLPGGTYSVASPITIPCTNGLTITGPVASPAAAVLHAAFSNSQIFVLNGCNGITVSYLHFDGIGGLYFNAANHANISVTNNQFTGLPSTATGAGVPSAAIYIDGNLSTTVTNFTATGNTFGDAASCSAVFTTVVDEGGNCIGIHAQPGIAINHTIEHNFFNHVEEGVHYANLASSGTPRGSPQSVTQNLQVNYNYFLNWHRIALELQGGLINVGQQVTDNVFAQPLNPSWGTMFISDACCTGGRNYLTSNPPNPANTTNDNLLWTDQPQQVGSFWAPVIGIEYWGGAGSTANGNFIEGNFSNQINWGFGVQPWYVQNNYQCAAHLGTNFVTNEENSALPIIANNTQVATCAQQVSAAPTITLAGNTFTLADSGPNTSIYYTVDGTQPVPGQGTTQLYTAPITVATTTTINAVGMWGVSPQPLSYPAPYGFVPSAVQSATYSGGSTTPAIVGGYLGNAGSINTLAVGAAGVQFTAYATYANGTNGALPDGSGNSPVWSSGDSSILSVSGSGLVTCIAAGKANVQASVNSASGVLLSPWTMTCTQPVSASIATSYKAGTYSLAIDSNGNLSLTYTPTQ